MMKQLIALVTAAVLTITSVPLVFQPVLNRQEVLKIKPEEVKKIYGSKKSLGGEIVLYARPYENDDNLYAALKKADAYYDLGAIGAVPFSDLAEIHNVELFGKQLLRIDGVYAYRAPQSNYYEWENAMLKPFLRVNGHVAESDLDKDGTPEIITTLGDPGVTRVYKKQDGGFAVANINEALGAESVTFQREDDLFLVHNQGQKKRYAYTKQGLQAEEEQ